jgi:hypothetical protein
VDSHWSRLRGTRLPTLGLAQEAGATLPTELCEVPGLLSVTETGHSAVTADQPTFCHEVNVQTPPGVLTTEPHLPLPY